jgi:rfaE bifunctional protein kinase chain/domain
MDAARLDALLDRFPAQRVLVAGDFFLDKYLDIDAALTEPSLETGLDAYQVVGVRNYPGAAGTVVNNLCALEVNVAVVGIIGDDGEGDDLRRGLLRLGVDTRSLLTASGRFTPTYLKPMLRQPARELNRLDTKNRTPLPRDLEDAVIVRLADALPHIQAVVIADQVSDANCGIITDRVRAALADLARAHPRVTFLADSRERIGLFREVIIKPNAREAQRATGGANPPDAARALRQLTGRPVVVTDGERGMLVCDEHGEQRVPAIHVSGPIDIVGAGDSALAGMAAALCAGATLPEAALVGNLAASITIQQLGVTGTATRAQVQARWAATTARATETG